MRRLPLLLSLIVVCLLASSARAQYNNAGGLVAALPQGSIGAVGVVPMADSGAIVVYADTRDLSVRLYARRLDHRGRAVWNPPDVTLHTGPQAYDVAPPISDGQGGAVVPIVVQVSDTQYNVVVQRVLGTGALAYAAAGLVVGNAPGFKSKPEIQPGPSNSYYVTWFDSRAVNPGIYGQRVTNAGAVLWAANGLRLDAVANPATSSYDWNTGPDELGGLLLGWKTNFDHRFQRFNSSGAPLWAAGGVLHGSFSDRQPTVAPDGSGGGWIVTIRDTTTSNSQSFVVANHVTAAGVRQYDASGARVTEPTFGQLTGLQAVRNGSGGCFAYYRIGFNLGQQPIYLSRQEINAGGDPLRGTLGEMLAGNVTEYSLLRLTDGAVLGYEQKADFDDFLSATEIFVRRYLADGTLGFAGGPVAAGRYDHATTRYGVRLGYLSAGVVMATWTDLRYSSHIPAAFAQAWTYPGRAAIWDDAERPVMRSAVDAAGDQGGRVRVSWDASVADRPGAIVSEYRVWRAVPGPVAQARGLRRPDAEGVFRAGDLPVLFRAAQFWELAGEQAAAKLASYALTVPTGQDSSAGGPANFDFMVEAVCDTQEMNGFSDVLSAHSVDNLAPGSVAPAAGVHSAGGTTLTWTAPGDADLCCYDVYRGVTAGFVADETNRVGTTSETNLVVPGQPAWFRIGARDIHGNRGPLTLVAPDGTVAVDDDSPRAWALRARWDRAGQSLVLAVDVPVAGDGTVELFDVAGRRLWSAPLRTAAAQSLSWSLGASERGLKSGLVLARVRDRSGRVLTTRAIVTR